MDDPVELPIDGALDLHTFSPKDIGELVPEYIRACRRQQLLNVRIIHGKGIGVLQRTVHAILNRIPEVESFHLAGGQSGGWGATIVHIKPIGSEETESKRQTPSPQS